MVRWNLPIDEELDDAGIRERIEVATSNHRDAGGIGDGHLEADPTFRLSLHDDGVQLVHQHNGLDELHVCKLRVPVDVGVGHQDVLGRGMRIAIGGRGHRQEGGYSDVVPQHHSVEHGL